MMICPRCGVGYPDTVAFCPNDGAGLVPQVPSAPVWQGQVPPMPGPVPPMPGQAPVYWQPAPMPAPKSNRGLIAVVLAIVLVVVVAGGAWLLLRSRPGPVVTPPVTTRTPTATKTTNTPVATTDWAKGLKQSWQQQFTNGAEEGWYSGGVLAMSPDVWMVADGTAALGIDANTGKTLWRLDSTADWEGCANTLHNGQLACLEPDQADSSKQDVCLINASDGKQTCTMLSGMLDMQPGWVEQWGGLRFADNVLIVDGNTGDPDFPYYRAVARVSLTPLKVEWVKAYTSDCGEWVEPEVPQKSTDGLTGNVLWFAGPIDDGPGILAVDIRNGQPLFDPASQGCVGIYPLNGDTFLASSDIPAGPLTLPGGGQINIVNSASGSIEYAGGQMPKAAVYFTASGWDSEYSIPTQATLGANGTDWQVSLPLQQILAAGGETYLTGAATKDTLVVAGAGTVTAVDDTTGRQIWSNIMPVSDYWDGGYSRDTLTVSIVGNVVVVTNSDYNLGDQTTLFSLATGEQVEQMPGAIVSPDGTMLASVTRTDTTMTITRYVPK